MRRPSYKRGSRLTRIIVADDSVINMAVVKEPLDQLGLVDKCVFCMNGEEAFKKCSEIIEDTKLDDSTSELDKQVPVCLMLLDYMMPRMTGI